MKPALYEIRRVLTSKFVIILIVAIVGLSGALAYESGVSYSARPTELQVPQVVSGYYINGSSITLEAYVFNGYGQQYGGATLNFTYNGITERAQESSDGFLTATFPFSPQVGSYSYNLTYRIFAPPVTERIEMPINPAVPYTGFALAPPVAEYSNYSNLAILVLYFGPGGKASPSADLIISNQSAPSQLSAVESSELFNASISGVTHEIVDPVMPLKEKKENLTAFVVSNSTVVYDIYIGHLSTYVPMTQSKLQGLVTDDTSFLIGFLMPILAVFSAYLTYGKDRTTGVIESVLKRPISRSGLIGSRFLSNLTAIIVAVALAMLVAQMIIRHYFGLYLSGSYTALFIFEYVVEGAAFLSLVYLISHLVKSQGALLGAAIGVYVVLGLFWSIIVDIVMFESHIPSDTLAYVKAYLAMEAISPSGFPTIAQFYHSHTLSILISSAQYSLAQWV